MNDGGEFWSFVIGLLLATVAMLLFSQDRVDLTEYRVISSISEKALGDGYQLCFDDDDVIRKSCIQVPNNDFAVGDTIVLKVYRKTQ